MKKLSKAEQERQESRERVDRSLETLAEREDALSKTAAALKRAEDKVAADKKVCCRCCCCVYARCCC